MMLPVYALSESGNERVLVGKAEMVDHETISVTLDTDAVIADYIRKGFATGSSVAYSFEPGICIDIMSVRGTKGRVHEDQG